MCEFRDIDTEYGQHCFSETTKSLKLGGESDERIIRRFYPREIPTSELERDEKINFEKGYLKEELYDEEYVTEEELREEDTPGKFKNYVQLPGIGQSANELKGCIRQFVQRNNNGDERLWHTDKRGIFGKNMNAEKLVCADRYEQETSDQIDSFHCMPSSGKPAVE
ncbi:unnamed protein product [Protopolystoma xenopodis]|uniref:Uncharacterized protein n=1 Tax=Protopolystoma xenopodis TaxID=117903 RepID=A0A448WDF9_9PLAT|nr:unnamed protein product [Protopolystoma xenopodis]